jgi:hypothetical protein
MAIWLRSTTGLSTGVFSSPSMYTPFLPIIFDQGPGHR